VKKPRTLILAALVAAAPLLLSAAGCKKQPPPETAPPAPVQPVEPPKPIEEPKPPPPPPPPPPPAPKPISASDLNMQKVLKPVFFDFDKYDLRDDARATLAANAEWLRANGKWRVLIEGHCDERGTNEYNMALGDRRANAAKSYLLSAGIGAERIRTISYGEERPADPGHDETAWAKNRRAEFVLED
jgi:peptidoglycan-associated lipoprotein